MGGSRSRPPESLTIGEARRIALAAQGFTRPRPNRPPGMDDVRQVIRRLGLLQIDYVNVIGPSHYHVLFSRLGPYDRTLLDKVVYRRREFTEQWAHEASIVPMETWPLLRHRMDTHRVRPYGFEAFLKQHPEYVASVLDEVRERGPLTAGDLPHPEGTPRRLAGAWVTSPRAVLESYFGRGLLAIAARRDDFGRVFDLAERIVPAEHLARRPERHEAQRELIRLAARAHGLGTAADLADYYRMPVRDATRAIAELAGEGELRPVKVEGWREQAWMDPQARLPERIEAAALLSPFDPVVWRRPRAERLFGFEYRFEIFVPEEKRRWGCYVLPFLMGDRLVARVDLKADRGGRRLLVIAAYLERGADADLVAGPLAGELRTLAGWLNLDSVIIGRKGDFARALRQRL